MLRPHDTESATGKPKPKPDFPRLKLSKLLRSPKAMLEFRSPTKNHEALKHLVTHRPLSSSFLGLPYRILNINHKRNYLGACGYPAGKSNHVAPSDHIAESSNREVMGSEGACILKLRCRGMLQPNHNRSDKEEHR